MHTLRRDGFDDFLQCHHKMLLLLLFDAARLLPWLCCSVFLPPRLLLLPFSKMCAHLACKTFIVIWNANKIHAQIYLHSKKNGVGASISQNRRVSSRWKGKNSIASRMNRTHKPNTNESSLNTIIFHKRNGNHASDGRILGQINR